MRIEKDSKIYRLSAGETFEGPDEVVCLILEMELASLFLKNPMRYIPYIREAYGKELADTIGGTLLSEFKKKVFNPNVLY